MAASTPQPSDFTPQRQPTLSVRALSTIFDTRNGPLVAVDELSFDIHPGECLGIVGESGSGKSVASLAVMGLVDYPGRVEAQSIQFQGRDLRAMSAKELRQLRGSRISMIFQDPLTALNPLFPVGKQMVDIIRAHRTCSKAEATAIAIEKLRLVGTSGPESRLRAYPWELSGGLRQRVAIAMSLLLDPDLVIADEPTTALDVSIQAQIIDLLTSLKQKMRFALIFISHDLGVVRSIADRVLVLYAGETVEVAPVGDLFATPHHPYTEGLIASAPTLVSGRDEPLRTIRGTFPVGGVVQQGCVFAPRCVHATDECYATRPPLVAASGTGRLVACFHPRNANSGEGAL